MIKSKRKNASPASAKPPVSHQLTELFWTLGPAFTRWAESHMHEQGFTPQRLRLLWLLHENGPMMMSALRDELGVAATTVTALVDALEKDGMALRRRHPTDRRATIIAVTAKGDKRIVENCAEFKGKVSELFSTIPKADQERFLGYLLHMREALVKRHILEESDYCPKSAAGKARS